MMKMSLAGLGMMILMTLGARADGTDWETDFAKASTNASKANLYMLLDFSGSDWCGWCKKLDAEVFSKAEFKEFAKDNLVCVILDFPRGKPQSKEVKDQNAGLAKKYGVEGFPTVIILAPDGSLVARTGYQAGGAKKYVESLKAMIAQHKQKQSAGAGEKK